MNHTPCMIIITHAWTVPYAELPSNEQKREWNQLRSRESIFYIIAFVVHYCRLTTITNSSEKCIQVIHHCYLEPHYNLLWVMYATVKFWLQYCYSYTELIIIHDYYAVLIIVFPTHKKKTQTSTKTNRALESTYWCTFVTHMCIKHMVIRYTLST